MAGELPTLAPSFGRLVFGKALSDTGQFLQYTKRDLILGGITLLLGGALAYVFVGKADTVKEIVFIAAFTFAPAGIVMFGVFVWHLWLAPSALAYEAVRAASNPAAPPAMVTVAPREKPINWSIWKECNSYNINELASILAKTDPSTEANTADRRGFLRLLQEDAMKKKIHITRSHLANSYETPDLWPSHFDVHKAEAMRWAKDKGFDLSHIA